MGENVLLECLFVFSPRDTWSSVFEFEHDITEFLRSKNKEVTIVKTVDGINSRRLYLIKDKPEIPAPQIIPPKSPTVKQQMENIKQTAPKING